MSTTTVPTAMKHVKLSHVEAPAICGDCRRQINDDDDEAQDSSPYVNQCLECYDAECDQTFVRANPRFGFDSEGRRI